MFGSDITDRLHFAWSESSGSSPIGGSPSGGSPNRAELERTKSAETVSKFGSNLGAPPDVFCWTLTKYSKL